MPLVLLMVLALGVFVFRRFEAMGTLLVLLAVMLLGSLIDGPVQARELQFMVEVLGLHFLTLVSLTVLLGSAIRFNWPDRNRLSQVAHKACLSLLITAGFLGLLKPDWELGGSSLAKVSAGGQFGLFLTGSWPGLLVWFGVASWLGLMSWPRLPSDLFRLLLATLRALWRGMLKAIQLACPFEPAPDELPESEAF